jgi:polyisoprenoid-binding protein YceI
VKKIGLLAIMACGFLYAGPLDFESGTIKAHTEVLGDSSINPMAKKAVSHLIMAENPATLHGSIEVSMADFMSDNRKRDEHMHESFESTVFPKATFEIKEVVAKGSDGYTLKGLMNFHGVTKAMNFESMITQDSGKVHIKGTADMKMSDFGMKPIKMLFLTVRDQVDLSVDVLLKR